MGEVIVLWTPMPGFDVSDHPSACETSDGHLAVVRQGDRVWVHHGHEGGGFDDELRIHALLCVHHGLQA
jgi:hypothetical protein